MEAKVYYWKDIKYLTQIEFAKNEAEIQAVLPSREQFAHDYALVATLKSNCEKNPLELAEMTFQLMNVEPQDHFRQDAYSEGIHHTSMSVGDIVIIGEVALIAMPLGFRQVRF
jgi:hypothetical protein